MTREEAKQLIPHLGSYNGEVFKVIDKLFDSFELEKKELKKSYEKEIWKQLKYNFEPLD